MSTVEPIVRHALDGVTPITEVRWRDHAKIAGRVSAMRVQPWGDGVATLEITVVDATGGLVAVFLGRRHIGGIRLGTELALEGTVVASRGQLAILNPVYTLLGE